MYILVDKTEKKMYSGTDLGSISEESEISVHTLRKWNQKHRLWHENVRYILAYSVPRKSRRGGLNSGNEKYFIK